MFNRSRVLLWTCAIVLAVAFVAVGVSKLGGPSAIRPAAVVLVALMIGAVFTHVLNAELARVVPPLVLGAIALLVCFRPERSGRRLASPKAR
jgi:uncharacterized membrane protein AbrB (regulator of aidB expression)